MRQIIINIKILFPEFIWSKVRRILIKKRHKKILSLIMPLIIESAALKNKCSNRLNPKKTFPIGTKLLWQYWAQGPEDKNCPELVRICFKSVEYYAKDFTIIRLTDNTIDEYLDIPDYINEKREKYSITHFSDLLRTMVLSLYGGLWLDASVLLTGEIPKNILDGDFFVYQRDMREEHKRYWERSFAYYWGWDDDFKVRILVGIMSAKKNSDIIKDICNLMLGMWEKFDKIPDYFVFSMLIGEYMNKNKKVIKPFMNDTIPHILRQHINGEYPYLTIDETLKLTSIHSLNYKNPNAVKKLKDIIDEYIPSLI